MDAIGGVQAFASYVGSGKARYAVMPNPLLHRGMPTRTVKAHTLWTPDAGGTPAMHITRQGGRDKEDECLLRLSRRRARLNS